MHISNNLFKINTTLGGFKGFKAGIRLRDNKTVDKFGLFFRLAINSFYFSFTLCPLVKMPERLVNQLIKWGMY